MWVGSPKSGEIGVAKGPKLDAWRFQRGCPKAHLVIVIVSLCLALAKMFV